MSSTIVKSIIGLILVAGLGLGGWYVIHIINDRAECKSDLAQLRHTEAKASQSAADAQKAADVAAIREAEETAKRFMLEAQAAQSENRAIKATLSQRTARRIAAESKSTAAKAQGAMCLAAALRKAEGFKPSCP